MMKFRNLPIFFAITLLGCAHSKYLEGQSKTSHQLVIQDEKQNKVYTSQSLLEHPLAQNLTTHDDPVYGANTYRAIPIHVLFERAQLDKDSTIVFTCADGFSAPINKDRLLNKDPKQAIAYLAIEPERQPWPKIRASSSFSAGPFYVVWENPEKSKIGKEEWPFQVVSFTVKAPAEKLYPHALPHHKIGKDTNVYKGYQAFMKNCFTCHTMNGEGESRLGPDLNIPYNPTEYLGVGFLQKQIRNPQAVRLWPQGKMTGFNPAAISDQEVQQIILYLQHMAKRKHSPGTDS